MKGNKNMLCYKCGKQMKNVLHFEPEREYQFNLCPNCRERTKKKRLHYEDILDTHQNKTEVSHEEDKKSRASI